jgi:hypothetical protein
LIEVKPMKAEDLLYVIKNGVKEVQLKMTPTEEMKVIAKQREESGMCVTGWVNGKPECVAGIDLLWEGVGDVWLMVTPAIDRQVKESYKCIRMGLKKLIEDHKLRRLQSYGRVDFKQCHTLFSHLGFEVEGLAREYTADGIDAIMYSLITE